MRKKGYIDLNEAAKLTNYTYVWLYTLCKKGTLQATFKGKCYVNKTALLAYAQKMPRRKRAIRWFSEDKTRLELTTLEAQQQLQSVGIPLHISEVRKARKSCPDYLTRQKRRIAIVKWLAEHPSAKIMKLKQIQCELDLEGLHAHHTTIRKIINNTAK